MRRKYLCSDFALFYYSQKLVIFRSKTIVQNRKIYFCSFFTFKLDFLSGFQLKRMKSIENIFFKNRISFLKCYTEAAALSQCQITKQIYFIFFIKTFHKNR